MSLQKFSRKRNTRRSRRKNNRKTMVKHRKLKKHSRRRRRRGGGLRPPPSKPLATNTGPWENNDTTIKDQHFVGFDVGERVSLDPPLTPPLLLQAALFVHAGTIISFGTNMGQPCAWVHPEIPQCALNDQGKLRDRMNKHLCNPLPVAPSGVKKMSGGAASPIKRKPKDSSGAPNFPKKQLGLDEDDQRIKNRTKYMKTTNIN